MTNIVRTFPPSRLPPLTGTLAPRLSRFFLRQLRRRRRRSSPTDFDNEVAYYYLYVHIAPGDYDPASAQPHSNSDAPPPAPFPGLPPPFLPGAPPFPPEPSPLSPRPPPSELLGIFVTVPPLEPPPQLEAGDLSSPNPESKDTASEDQHKAESTSSADNNGTDSHENKSDKKKLGSPPHLLSDSFFEAIVPGPCQFNSKDRHMRKASSPKNMAAPTPPPPSPPVYPAAPMTNFNSDAPAPWGIGHPYKYMYGNHLMPPHQHPGFPSPPPPPHPMLPMVPTHPGPRPSHDHPPPPPTTRDLVRSDEITITHSNNSPAIISMSYHDDPYNIRTPHYGTTHKHVALQYHICSICRRPRSSRYHRQHPLIPGQQIIPAPCRKCRSAVSSSSSEDETKVIVNRPGKRAVRESESVRILSMEDQDHHRGHRHRHRSGSRTRIIIREVGDRHPDSSTSSRGHHGRAEGREVVTIEETERLSRPHHGRPESRTRIYIRDTESAPHVHSPHGTPPLPSRKDEGDDKILIRRTKEFRTHSVSPEPAKGYERRLSPRHAYDGARSPEGPRHKPVVHRQMSDAERRLSEHPEPFRHRVIIPASHHNPGHPSPVPHSHEPTIEPPPLHERRSRFPRSPSPPRPAPGPRRHSIQHPSQVPVEHHYDHRSTRLRSILRSGSRPRSGSCSPSPPPQRDSHGKGFGGDRTEHDGPRVSFAPDPPSPRRRAPSTHHERDRGHEPSRSRRTYRADVDGHASSGEFVTKLGSRRLNDYDYWQEPSHKSLQPLQDDEMYESDRRPAKDRIVRKPSFSHDHHDIPTASRIRHVHAPDHVTYHQSPTPPLSSAAPTLGSNTYIDYAGKHTLPEATEDMIPWSVQSIQGSSMSDGSYRLVDVKDVNMIDDNGRSVRMREIEETYHPNKGGGRGRNQKQGGKTGPESHRAVQHDGWRDI